MKNMKKLFVIGLFIGLLGLGKVHASSVFTTTFTAVCVNGSSPSAVGNNISGFDMELLRVEYSSGNAGFGTSFLLLYDTPTVECKNIATAAPLAMADQSLLIGTRWVPSQMLTPPIMLPSSPTAGGYGNGSGNGYVDFTDAQGNGRQIDANLVVLKGGVDVGTVVTFVYRKRRTSVEH